MPPRFLLIVLVVAWCLLCAFAFGAEPPHHAYRAELAPEQRVWYRNPDGSCVQCSNGMAGVQSNVISMSTLLWDTDYGPAVRGGSSPSRVENYCDKRGITVYNVTGSQTWDWMKWACKTGRFPAIGAGTRHFQFLYGWDPVKNRWYVCNNNSPRQIDEYSWEEFQRLHLASGQWVVVPDYPPLPMLPRYVPWWTW